MSLNRFVHLTTRAALLTLVLLWAGCASPEPSPEYTALNPANSGGPSQDSSHRVAVISGLLQPEAVRYDAETDAYFISNFNGAGSATDENGFITRVDASTGDVTVQFAVGGTHPLHAPRGMYVVDNALWVADVAGVHAFDKETGDQLQFVDFSSFEHGFLNDLAADSAGTLYVTETGGRRIFRIIDGIPEVYLADVPNPNGITYRETERSLILAPWDEGEPVSSIDLKTDSLHTVLHPGADKIDGLEFWEGRMILAAQSDSTIKVFDGSKLVASIKTDGKPADIAIDTERRRVAVPYIALNRVDIWELPE